MVSNKCSSDRSGINTAAVHKPLKTVSLFSGAGGLDVGLHSTGAYDILACVENNPRCCATLELNKRLGLFASPNTKILQRDLSHYHPRQLMDELDLEPGEVDVLVGGPPCQSFSTAGRRRTVQDPRGTLLWDFLAFVDALRPRAFLLENVRGLLSAALRHRPIADRPEKGGLPLGPDEEPGSVVAMWMDDLASIDADYRVDCFEVNAVNYGAPQLRERVLFFGNRTGHLAEFPEPTHGPDGLLPYATLRSALEGFNELSPVLMDFSPRKKRYLAMVPPGGNWRTLPPEIAEESMGRAFHAKGGRSGWWRRLSWDLPCPTIVTMPNHASTSMCHPDEVRVLSVGECARIQGFPDTWRFCGSPAEQMSQVGNAVPARLGEVSADVLVRQFEDEPPSARPQRFRRVYIKSHVRTRRWYSDGEAVVWEDGAARVARRLAA
jgi:DNA (cytosine-5)-methyltransferase 1